MNNIKRNKRLYCPAMTDSLTSSSEFEKMSHQIPLKKRKINHTKFEEIWTKNTQCSNKNLNIPILNSEEKENSNFSNFSFVINSTVSNISSTVSNLAQDLNKIKIQPKENLKREGVINYNSRNLNNGSSKFSNEAKNFSQTNPLKRNFSLSELNTQTRSNFKNIFQEIIKNQIDLNRNSNKTNSFSTSHSNSNLNLNFKNKKTSKNEINFFPLKKDKTSMEKVKI